MRWFYVLKIYIFALSIVDISMKEIPLEDLILFQIDKTSKVSKVYSQREFDKVGLGITIDQWVLLKIIQGSGQLSQKELADKSLRDPASITRTLDLLEKKGYVERMPVEGNRRQHNIVVTKAGEKFITKHMKMVNEHRELSTKGFTKKEMETLMALLLRIQENMS